MGLGNFSSSGDDDSDDQSDSGSDGSSSPSGLAAFTSSSSSGRGGSRAANRDRWTTKIDFGRSYIIVARDRQGNTYKHRDQLCVLDDNLDWRRLDDHPNRQFEVIFQASTKRYWLRFCNRAQDQLGEDPEAVFDDDPTELARIRDEVYFPPGSKPDQSLDCRVCGSNSRDDDCTILEMDLGSHHRLPVCASHTIQELAHEGLLD